MVDLHVRVILRKKKKNFRDKLSKSTHTYLVLVTLRSSNTRGTQRHYGPRPRPKTTSQSQPCPTIRAGIAATNPRNSVRRSPKREHGLPIQHHPASVPGPDRRQGKAASF